MVYKVVSTDEMDRLLDNCVLYLLKKLKSEQAAVWNYIRLIERRM